ncbi:sigma-54 interaction domain-containing protein [Ferroacidibacillus organovorans]|nr:sigma-54-dependent Fis family transcriptional regulator [Ferroacidibacillus organovorans]
MTHREQPLEWGQPQLQLDALIHAMHDAMVAVDRMETIVLFNPSAERLTGVRVEDALGKSVSAVIPNSRLPHILLTGQAEINQVQMLHHRSIITNRVPVLSPEGEVTGAIAVFRDTTELLDLAAEVLHLKEIQTLLEAIFEATQDAISVVDQYGNGLRINSAYTRLTGLAEQDVIGKAATVDIAEGESMHMHVLQTGLPVRNVSMKVGPFRKDVLVNVAPIHVRDHLIGSVAVIHDLSEMRALTEQLQRANAQIRRLATKYTFSDIIAKSPAMLEALEAAKKAAQTRATVLLRGESGCGKELFAHAIHQASDRVSGPFLRVNCAALSESVLESELFGYVEGAFTGARKGGKRGFFEESNGGTLFLDEIAELSIGTQAKLLRVLQEREIIPVGGTHVRQVDVRVIAATHVNLEKAIVDGRFREDLYYRLHVLPISIPPLRKRTQDIPLLAFNFLARLNAEYGRHVHSIAEDALQPLFEYAWPGNVRELENVMSRAMIRMDYREQVIERKHIVPSLEQRIAAADVYTVSTDDTLANQLKRAERMAIHEALKKAQGNREEAAERLGVSVRSLYYKLSRYQE